MLLDRKSLTTIEVHAQDDMVDDERKPFSSDTANRNQKEVNDQLEQGADGECRLREYTANLIFENIRNGSQRK